MVHSISVVHSSYNNELKIQALEDLRDARLRFDQAVSGVEKEKALQEYDGALTRFCQLAGLRWKSTAGSA